MSAAHPALSSEVVEAAARAIMFAPTRNATFADFLHEDEAISAATAALSAASEAIRQEEREACAQIAKAYGSALHPAPGWSKSEKGGFETGALDCSLAIAQAIRNRSKDTSDG